MSRIKDLFVGENGFPLLVQLQRWHNAETGDIVGGGGGGEDVPGDIP